MVSTPNANLVMYKTVDTAWLWAKELPFQNNILKSIALTSSRVAQLYAFEGIVIVLNKADGTIVRYRKETNAPALFGCNPDCDLFYSGSQLNMIGTLLTSP